MAVDRLEDLALVVREVPDEHGVVEAGAEQDVASRRMPFDVQNAAAMAQQLQLELGEVRGEAAFRDSPNFYLKIDDNRE